MTLSLRESGTRSSAAVGAGRRADPAVLSAATRSVQSYLPEYTFDRTSHVRLSRIYGLGKILRRLLDPWLPGWEGSATLSLLLERQSLATLVMAIFLVVFFTLSRVGLRWYGERRLGLRTIRVRDQFQRAYHGFMDAAG